MSLYPPILIQNILDEVKARNFPLYPFIAQQEGRSLPKLRRFPRELPKSGKHNLHQSTATTGNPAVAQGTPVAARRYFEASKGRTSTMHSNPVTGAERKSAIDPVMSGDTIMYRTNENNHCPGCRHSHRPIGRMLAERAFCGIAL